jgi:hypothetical protein
MGNPLLFPMFAQLMAWNLTLMAWPAIMASMFMPTVYPPRKGEP